MTEAEEIIKLKKQLEYSESIRQLYENGGAKLYYALQRKMSEMAEILNSNSLKGIDLTDPKDKTYDRIFKILEKSETVSNSANLLGIASGVTGDEKKDTEKVPFIETISIKRD